MSKNNALFSIDFTPIFNGKFFNIVLPLFVFKDRIHPLCGVGSSIWNLCLCKKKVLWYKLNCILIIRLGDNTDKNGSSNDTQAENLGLLKSLKQKCGKDLKDKSILSEDVILNDDKDE